MPFVSRTNYNALVLFLFTRRIKDKFLKGDFTMLTKKATIIKFEALGEQTVGQIKKMVGFTKAKFFISVIDNLDLDANPRSSKTGPVTDSIQDSIRTDSNLFPFKTKGVLIASSQYEILERGRIKIMPENPEVEGILDGGHNTLAIGLYILEKALSAQGQSLPRGAKTWDQFKSLWEEKSEAVYTYLDYLRNNSEDTSLDFYIPIELLVPRDTFDIGCVESFKNDLFDICAARNNNVQLAVSSKVNQLGYFDDLKNLFDQYSPDISCRIEWKSNTGGNIKAQDIVALAWIPLSLITPVHDKHHRSIGPVAANLLYSSKGACLKQFEKLMASPEVTEETNSDYKRKLINLQVSSAFRITVDLPELYDYIYEKFPDFYNSAFGGKFGRITAVKTQNEKCRGKYAPFTGRQVETLSPEGFVIPLVYGLQALMKKESCDGHNQIVWIHDPLSFLKDNLPKIVKYYSGILSMCDYDPQKVGKNLQSYEQALAGFKMAIAGIL